MILEMKIVGVIPARWQSSRFPGKPLVDILGKSLIQRSYENASRCQLLDHLLIATDDERILSHAEGFGADVCMTASDCATGTDRTWHAVEARFPNADIIVNIQGDEPCLEPEVVDLLVALLQNVPEASMTTAVSPLANSQMALLPNVVKCVFDRQGKALYFSRHPIPFAHKNTHIPTYYRHIGVYCFRRDALEQYVKLEQTPLQLTEDLEQLKMLEHGMQIHVCVVDDQAAGVDIPADVRIIEKLLCQKESISL